MVITNIWVGWGQKINLGNLSLIPHWWDVLQPSCGPTAMWLAERSQLQRTPQELDHDIQQVDLSRHHQSDVQGLLLCPNLQAMCLLTCTLEPCRGDPLTLSEPRVTRKLPDAKIFPWYWLWVGPHHKLVHQDNDSALRDFVYSVFT